MGPDPDFQFACSRLLQANRIFDSTSDQPGSAARQEHGGTRVLFDDSEDNAAKAFVQ